MENMEPNFSPAVDTVEKTKLYANENEIPDSIKGNHLEQSEEQRIKIRMYDSSDPEQYIRFALGEGAGKQFIEGTLVNYYEDKENLKEQGMLGGYPGYVISQVDETAKRSYSYRNCMGIIAVAEDKETGKQISFLSHQNPSFFLSIDKEEFEKDIYTTIETLVSRAKEGTIDVGIMGGNYYDSVNNENKYNKRIMTNAEQHKLAVSELSKLIEKSFKSVGQDVPIVVMSGADYSDSPSTYGDTDIVLDTQARLLLTARPTQFYGISNEIYDSIDSEKFINVFDENKTLLQKTKKPHHSDKITRQTEYNARLGRPGQDITPLAERKIYDDLKEINVKVFDSFERVNLENPDSFNAKWYRSPETIILGQEEGPKKIKAILNIFALINEMSRDLVNISKKHMKIVSPQNSFLYAYNTKTHEVSYVIGGVGGFKYIEENVDTREHALIQNMASFMKSFHTFLDQYVTSEDRNKYMELLNQKIKFTIEDEVSETEYKNLFETF